MFGESCVLQCTKSRFSATSQDFKRFPFLRKICASSFFSLSSCLQVAAASRLNSKVAPTSSCPQVTAFTTQSCTASNKFNVPSRHSLCFRPPYAWMKYNLCFPARLSLQKCRARSGSLSINKLCRAPPMVQLTGPSNILAP